MSESTNPEPRRVIVLNRDLLFGSRIRGALSSLGLEGLFVASTEPFMDRLNEQAEEVALGIVDMNGTVDWDVIGEALSSKEGTLAPTLAFGPHVDVASRRAAKAAGITRIVSNGQFHADMSGLIDRYRRRGAETRNPSAGG